MNSRVRRLSGKLWAREHRGRLLIGSMIIFVAFNLFPLVEKQFSFLRGVTGRITVRMIASTLRDVNRFPHGLAG